MMNQENFPLRWRTNFFTGLAIVFPAIISIAVLIWLFGTISNITDTLLFFLPQEWTHKDKGAGPVHWYWSAVALVLAVIFIMLIGRFARHYFAEQLIQWSDRLLLRVPLLNKIYGTVKQINDAFSNNKSSFKQVVLVPFPQPNMYSLGFVSSEQKSPLTGEKLLGVFIPTTPNPTSGFLVLVPESQATLIEMSVPDAIKFIISFGSISREQAIALKQPGIK
jgi:uncharacterized membrane protein